MNFPNVDLIFLLKFKASKNSKNAWQTVKFMLKYNSRVAVSVNPDNGFTLIFYCTEGE